MTFGSLCVLKHLFPRLTEAWHNKRPTLIEAITALLEEQNLGVRKALAEVRFSFNFSNIVSSNFKI